MTEPIDRLRRADPAAGLGAQPDERAEADLALLLAEPRPAPARAGRPAPRRIAPILVTAVVAIAVVALTAAVLAFAHPRTDAGGTGTPTLGTASCHPAAVLPFQCGTYRSTYGGAAITGDSGGPAKDRLSISFTAQEGGLLLSARTGGCFAEQVLVRYDGTRLVRIGPPVYGQNGCFGKGADTGTWAYAFLRGPLQLTGTDGPYFGSGRSSVFFEYEGAAPIGAAQLPRNDTGCVTAHVQPFPCGNLRSTAGTGALAFLGSSPYTLGFRHLNAQLTAGLSGGCNELSFALEPDGDSIVVAGSSATDMLCLGPRGAHDTALSRFFGGVLTARISGTTITFAKGSSSATFQRG